LRRAPRTPRRSHREYATGAAELQCCRGDSSVRSLCCAALHYKRETNFNRFISTSCETTASPATVALTPQPLTLSQAPPALCQSHAPPALRPRRFAAAPRPHRFAAAPACAPACARARCRCIAPALRRSSAPLASDRTAAASAGPVSRSVLRSQPPHRDSPDRRHFRSFPRKSRRGRL
jgi:hypothetical protein